MSALHSGAATLPRGFRYHHPDFPEPKTPEPFVAAESEAQPPSPAPKVQAQASERLAISGPYPAVSCVCRGCRCSDPEHRSPRRRGTGGIVIIFTDNPIPAPTAVEHTHWPNISPKAKSQYLFAPKTPAPDGVASLSPRRYPDWTIDSIISSSESSPECESSRPSTARSTYTSASLFSRISLASDEAHCISPEYEGSSFSIFGQPSKDVAIEVPSTKSKGKMRKAPWTKAMSEHLWSTYLMYCQDPKVTPFRAGRNGIPLTEFAFGSRAKRSAAGKAQDRCSPLSRRAVALPPPQRRLPPTFNGRIRARPRARLRELCRMKTTSSAARTHQYLSHSPTPLAELLRATGTANLRHFDPLPPLAQLTSSALEPPALEGAITEPVPELPEFSLELPEGLRNRLGSPFSAASRSYGPSSSNTLAAGFSFRSNMPPRQISTLEPKRGALQSPARLTRSRSNTLQKRRSRQAANELRKGKRPSLGSDLWTAPGFAGDSLVSGESLMARLELEFSSTSSTQRDDLFVPRTNIEELLAAVEPPSQSEQPTAPALESTNSLMLPQVQPPRLGSPFAAPSASLSFPNRLSQPHDLIFGAVRRPFATVQQPTQDVDAAAKPNLETRLTYINERLREFRQRGNNRQRSESPF
ncbi:unnamed protein product [Parascedosporium putredinis]|uniref:Uncharacterized protein n=1 Tax=Parascedosporium putredinis TaxID=1442378 RepID=A0A9P1H6V7_9PEZI|nr:unnamed protein product [Parascedosporium putredinis]CAI7997897.1 unnamed protein product [Parascedosporium putredinis]